MLQMINYFDLLEFFRQKIIGVKFQGDIADYVIFLPRTTQNVQKRRHRGDPFRNFANI